MATTGIRGTGSAFLSESVRIAQFANAYGLENAYSIIEMYLVDLNNFAGANQKMSSMQIEEEARIFYCKAFFLNVCEVCLFFNRVKEGRYGLFYGVVDPITINFYLDKYLCERSASLHAIEKEQEQEKRKQDEKAWEEVKMNMTDEDYKKISDLRKHLTLKP